MKKETKAYILGIALPLAVGSAAALFTMGSMNDYDSIAKPALSPPGWVFPVVWSLLFVLMGISSARIYLSKDADSASALKIYALQLAVNFFWSIIFFNLKWYVLSFIWILLLLALIIIMIRKFYPIDKPSAYLLIPYLLWVAFASYLTFYFAFFM